MGARVGERLLERMIGIRHYRDPDELLTAARAVLDSFRALCRVHGRDAKLELGLTVAQSPFLIHGDPEGQRIVLPLWDLLTEAQRQLFVSFAESPSRGEALFDAVANWFLIPHEIAHFLQREAGSQLSRYQREQSANDLAAAYWKQVGREAELQRLRAACRTALTRLRAQLPGLALDRDAFDRAYLRIADDQRLYGYYQFTMIEDALGRLEMLGLAECLAAL